MIFWQLFYSFLKIGLFGFGGGYAMLSLIQNEVVVEHQWITAEEFTDIVAISQMTPGPISINCATYIGYTASGGSVWGAALATIGVCFPPIVLMTIASLFFVKLRKNPYTSRVMRSMRPVIIGLILSAALILCTKENFIDYKSYLIFGAAFIAVIKNVNPILVVVLAGIVGYLVY